MVNVQVAQGVLEVVDGTSFPITLNVAEIRDISQKKGGFSKSIEFTGSKSNLQILGHLYNVNIDDATFDINALNECSVIQNGITILERFYLQLISVNKQQQSNGEDEIITFTAVVKDSVSDFFTNISNKYLNELDLSDLNHVFDAPTVIGSFNNTVVDGYKYPLMYTPTSTIPIKEFKPAIFAKTYLDRIFARAGLSYSWSGLIEARFDKLIVPYNGDGSAINVDNFKVQFSKLTALSGTHASGNISINNFTQLTSVTELTDVASIFNPTTGQYSSPFYVTSGESININANVSRLFELINSSGVVARIKGFEQSTGQYYNGSNRYTVGLFVYRNGLQVGATPILQNDFSSLLAPGTTTVVNDTVTASIQISNLQVNDIITFKIGIVTQFTDGKWVNNATNAPVNISYNFSNNCFITVTPSSNNSGLFGTVQIKDVIPKQIKQSDFVKSIFTLYNLWAVPDEDQPNNIILIHRDEYLDAGISKNWESKLDHGKEQTITFLPDITSKKTILTYKDDQDEVNKIYKLTTNETYGQLEFTFDSEHNKGIDRKELIFSPTPSVVTSYGAIVPMINGSTPKTNIRLLIDSGEKPLSTPITIQQYVGSTFTSNVYPQVSHFENAESTTFDINFGLCDFYFHPIEFPTANNAYNLYWRRTMGQLNTGKMLTAIFDLNESDIKNLKLNDKIFVLNAYWNINKVIDYDANSRSLTKVELVSVDDAIALPPFRIRIVKPSFNGDFQFVKDKYIKQFQLNNNITNGGEVVGDTGVVLPYGGGYVKNMTVETLNGYPVINKPQYKATAFQLSTNAPTISRVLQNDLNVNPTWTYISTGTYELEDITTTESTTALITESEDLIITENFFKIILEKDSANLIGTTILEASHSGNLNDGDYLRFSINGSKLRMYTYSGGFLSNDVIPSDIPWIFTLTFFEK